MRQECAMTTVENPAELEQVEGGFIIACGDLPPQWGRHYCNPVPTPGHFCPPTLLNVTMFCPL